MLTVNRVITLSTVSSGYSELYCRSGAWSAASQKSGGAARSVSGRCRKTMERSGARSERSQSGNGAGSGGYRNWLVGARSWFFAAVFTLVLTVSYF